MTEKEQKVVQVLLDNPGLTSAKLTRKLGWRAQAWHLHFGTMCSDRRGRLWPGPRSEKREAEFYTGIIADFDQHTHSFAMKPEAMKAFAALGLHGR